MMVKHFSSDTGIFFYSRGLPVDRGCPGLWKDHALWGQEPRSGSLIMNERK